MSLKEKIQKAKQASGEVNQALGQTCKKLSSSKAVEIGHSAKIEIEITGSCGYNTTKQYVDFTPNEALEFLEWLKTYEQEIKELKGFYSQEE